jgi:hypothetical protein
MNKYQSKRISFLPKATLTTSRSNKVTILRKIFAIIWYFFSIRYHPSMFNNVENKYNKAYQIISIFHCLSHRPFPIMSNHHHIIILSEYVLYICIFLIVAYRNTTTMDNRLYRCRINKIERNQALLRKK